MRRKGCDRVVGCPGRWQWLQMRARIGTTVPCDAVQARPAGRAGALVKAVFTTSMTRLSTAGTSCSRAGRGHIGPQQQRPAHGACGEAACSLMTSFRTRRLQCLDPLLARSLQQPRTLDGGRRARSFLGGVVSASRYASTRWKCGRRGSVLPNVALRSVRVSILLLLLRHRGNGGCKLGFRWTGEGRAADGR